MILPIFTFLLTSTLLAASPTIEEICQQKLGASTEDYQATQQFEYPQSRLQMCLYDCIFQAAGYSDGRHFLREGILKQAKVDEDPYETLLEMAEQCDGISNEYDSCVLAADIVDCFRNVFAKH